MLSTILSVIIYNTGLYKAHFFLEKNHAVDHSEWIIYNTGLYNTGLYKAHFYKERTNVCIYSYLYTQI